MLVGVLVFLAELVVAGVIIYRAPKGRQDGTAEWPRPNGLSHSVTLLGTGHRSRDLLDVGANRGLADPGVFQEDTYLLGWAGIAVPPGSQWPGTPSSRRTLTERREVNRQSSGGVKWL